MNDVKLENQLSPDFPKIRLLSELITNMIGFLVLGLLFWLNYYFSWPTWAFWILIALLAFAILGTIWSFIEPQLLYRNWSYQFDDEYLQMRYGVRVGDCANDENPVGFDKPGSHLEKI